MMNAIFPTPDNLRESLVSMFMLTLVMVLICGVLMVLSCTLDEILPMISGRSMYQYTVPMTLSLVAIALALFVVMNGVPLLRTGKCMLIKLKVITLFTRVAASLSLVIIGAALGVGLFYAVLWLVSTAMEINESLLTAFMTEAMAASCLTVALFQLKSSKLLKH
jgi:hypothetical protein